VSEKEKTTLFKFNIGDLVFITIPPMEIVALACANELTLWGFDNWDLAYKDLKVWDRKIATILLKSLETNTYKLYIGAGQGATSYNLFFPEVCLKPISDMTPEELLEL